MFYATHGYQNGAAILGITKRSKTNRGEGPVEFVEVPMFKIADKRTGKIMLDQFIETREQADKCIKDGWHFEKRPQLRKHLTPVIAIFAQKVEEQI